MSEPEPGALTAQNGNPQGIELRGYEIARKVSAGWSQQAKFRPNTWGFQEAAMELKRLCETWTDETYRIRPIISFETGPGLAPQEQMAEAPSG